MLSEDWLDSEEVAIRYGLSKTHARRILQGAYYQGKSWDFGGERYELHVDQIPHPLIANRTKYIVRVATLPNPETKRTFHPPAIPLDTPLTSQFEPFCDWITIHQEHALEFPNVNDGHVISFNIDGSEEWTADKYFPITGSHDTTFRLRVTSQGGHTLVSLSGNISRFGRLDNVFGLSIRQTVKKVNDLLSQITFKGHNIPPFTVGEFYLQVKRSQSKTTTVPAWTGARVSRIDLTCNYALGNAATEKKAEFLSLLSLVGVPHLLTASRPGTDGQVRSVYWGNGTTRRANKESHMYVAKVYDKAEEIKSHTKKELAQHPDYFNALIAFLERNNVLRFEVKFKQKYLARQGLNYLGNLIRKDNDLLPAFKALADKIIDKQIDVTKVDELRQIAKASYKHYLSWERGDNVRSSVSYSTFKKHRKIIRDIVGVDISLPKLNEVIPTVKTIKPFPIARPDWYSLDYSMG